MFMNKDPTSGVKGLDGCPVIIMMIHLVGNAMPIVPTDVKIWTEQRGIVSITIPLRILRLLKIKHLRVLVSILGKENVRKTVGSFPLIIPEWSHINVWQSMLNVHRYAETIKGEKMLFSTNSSGFVIYVNLIPFQLMR
jgi:hypothetical protein